MNERNKQQKRNKNSESSILRPIFCGMHQQEFPEEGTCWLLHLTLRQLGLLQLKFRMFHFSIQQSCYSNFDTTVPETFGYFCPATLAHPAYMYNSNANSAFSPQFLLPLPLSYLTQQHTTPIRESSESFSETPKSPKFSSCRTQKRRTAGERREREKVKQKLGRNICSNIMHLIINFIKDGKKLRKKVEAVIERDGMNIKVESFFQMLNTKSDKLEAYLTGRQIDQLWRGPYYQEAGEKAQKEEEFSKIFRILGKLYLQDFHLNYVYNSNKIKKASKGLHSGQIRRILAL